MRLIYLSPLPWASFAQRPHQFVEWFHQRSNGPVLWIDPYPTRLPSLADFRRMQPAAQASCSTLPDWLTVLSPQAFPLEPVPGSLWLNQLLWNPVFASVREFSLGHPTILAIGKPSAMALQLLADFPDCLSLYDAMDDFSAFYGGLSRYALAQCERRIVAQVNKVWVSSTELEQHWSNVHRDVRLVHNGLDPDSICMPSRPAVRSHRVLGYVGTVAKWFDWKWIMALARIRPGDVVRIIGPVFLTPPKNLPDNVELLPACTHRAAIAAMGLFDVGLIPFNICRLTASVDPIKFYEYRVLRVPIISTNFGEMRFRNHLDGVWISHSSRDIQNQVEAAMELDRTRDIDWLFARNHSWSARFDLGGLLEPAPAAAPQSGTASLI